MKLNISLRTCEFILLVLFVAHVDSFQTVSFRCGSIGKQALGRDQQQHRYRPILMLSQEETSTTPETSTASSEPAASFVPGAKENDSTSSNVLAIPSPILLGGSMVLGIAATGSLFELSGGDPKIGLIPTVVIAMLGFPGCIFLFLEAVKKATEETEEDDKRFRGEL